MHASMVVSLVRLVRVIPVLGLAAFVTASCGAVAESAPTGSDAGAPGASTPDASTTREAGVPPSGLCTGTAPRLFVNGEEVPVLEARGKAIAMNCCDAGELIIAAGTFAAPVFFSWRVAATTNGHIDFGAGAKAGAEPGAELAIGCDPLTSDCKKAGGERFASGFTGTIDFAATSTGQTASYCVSVTEAPGAPNTRFHSMTIYAPKVDATF